MQLGILQAAQEWGISEETVRKLLVAGGHEIKRGMKLSIREFSACIHGGDYKKEKIRLTRAEADAREAKNLEIAGRTILRDDALKLVADKLSPMRSALLSWPAALSARLNPSDPELARTVLDAEVRRLLEGQQ